MYRVQDIWSEYTLVIPEDSMIRGVVLQNVESQKTTWFLWFLAGTLGNGVKRVCNQHSRLKDYYLSFPTMRTHA
jgi:hypothetical protein